MGESSGADESQHVQGDQVDQKNVASPTGNLQITERLLSKLYKKQNKKTDKPLHFY